MLRPIDPLRVPALPRVAVLLLVLWGASACGGSDTRGPASTLTTDEFIAVVVEIREAERDVQFSDSAQTEFEARKREIFERYGTGEDDLRRFLSAHGEDVDFLRELWDTLNQRLRHVPPRHDPTEDGPVPLVEDP